MWSRADTRLLWVGAIIAISVAVTSVWHSGNSAAYHAGKASEQNKASSEPNDETFPPSAPQRSLQRVPNHRSPEDDVSIDALRDLLIHPNYAIRTAATRLVLTRLARHRLFTQQHRHCLSYRFEVEHEGATHFHRSIAILESYGWAGKNTRDGEIQSEAVPEGVWEGLVRGYQGWADDWERRYGTRIGTHTRVESEQAVQNVDLLMGTKP